MWHNVKQNTDEWEDLRKAKVTGSSIACVMAHSDEEGNGKFGDPAKDLAVKIAIERLTGEKVPGSGFKNGHMDRGHIEEPVARMMYEDTYFVDVLNGGFFDNGDTGSSPDGLVWIDGMVEIKSAIPSVQYARIKRGSYDPSYKWQYVFNMREAGRDWIDFISYCSSFPVDKRLFVHRLFKRDFAKEIKMINQRLPKFFAMVDAIQDRIVAYK